MLNLAQTKPIKNFLPPYWTLNIKIIWPLGMLVKLHGNNPYDFIW